MRGCESMVIKPADFGDARVQALLTRHLEGMHAHSPSGHVFALDWTGLQQPGVSLYALWKDDTLLGLGALKALDAMSGEVKSMRTADAHLRQGVGTAMLEHIIGEALRRGYTRLSLETGTGPAFEPALALYRKRGFTNGAAFGGYTQSRFNQFLHLDLHPAMDAVLRQQMLAYYDERASEYDEAYTRGTGTSSIADPTVFTAEAATLEGVVAHFARGGLLDLACGTAYWLPHYAARCDHVTLFDQSSRMLAEAQERAARLGILDRCTVVQGDLFEYEFPQHGYDRVLVGFFLSHLTVEQEPLLFHSLNRLLRDGGRFLILDSAWSPERAAVNAKVERQARYLNDGTAFEVYKRYCDRGDLSRWAQTYDITLDVEYFGRAFYAVSGAFERPGHRAR
jgi:putative acetyltransferase